MANKLGDAHKEQVVNMYKDGKTYQEIRAFFSKEYNITLYDNEVTKVLKEMGVELRGRGRKAGAKGKSPDAILKRKYIKKGKKIHSKDDCPVPTVDDFESHIRQAFAIVKKEFIQRTMAIIDKL
jgi:hypothetical protein